MPGKARLGYNIISVEIENITAGYYDCSLPCCESDHATDNSFLSQSRLGHFQEKYNSQHNTQETPGVVLAANTVPIKQ